MIAALPLVANASVPTVAYLDAMGRASGNARETAVRIGESVFKTQWPVQILQIGANRVGPHVVIGVRMSGVHFHRAVSRAEFDAEVATLIAQTFAAAPEAEEIDLWTSIPIPVPKHAVVAGDLAVPTWRTVFTLSARRGESPAALAARLRSGAGLYVDEDWARDAFKKST